MYDKLLCTHTYFVQKHQVYQTFGLKKGCFHQWKRWFIETLQTHSTPIMTLSDSSRKKKKQKDSDKSLLLTSLSFCQQA